MTLENARLIPLETAIIGAGSDDEIELIGDVCTIGRSENCHIVVRRNDISRLHARIERDGHRYLLIDTDSANGTFVNSMPLSGPHLLRNRDLIGLGESAPLLRFVDPDPTVERRGRLRYDDDQMAFTLDGKEVKLTPNEQRLLNYLFRHQNVVCHHEKCAQAVWSEDFEPGRDSRLEGVMRDLRKKLDAVESGAGDMIVTYRGKGYKLVAEWR